MLHLLISDRRHDEPVRGALTHELRCDARRRGRHEDAVVRRVRRVSDRGISRDDLHVLVAELRQQRARSIREREVSFDRDDVARELREHRGLVPGSRADLEHVMRRLEVK